MRLEPELEESYLPEFVAPEPGGVGVGLREEPVDVLLPEDAALSGGRGVERLLHQIEVGAFEVFQGRNREVPLLRRCTKIQGWTLEMVVLF